MTAVIMPIPYPIWDEKTIYIAERERFSVENMSHIEGRLGASPPAAGTGLSALIKTLRVFIPLLSLARTKTVPARFSPSLFPTVFGRTEGTASSMGKIAGIDLEGAA
ncbi:MAG: hypothetical protein LBH51_02530 [Treponema sp.]|jgi:hypothetical protein|nr:hypothetical protein [Treponema sp.]